LANLLQELRVLVSHAVTSSYMLQYALDPDFALSDSLCTLLAPATPRGVSQAPGRLGSRSPL
jgi:hypothetical protein